MSFDILDDYFITYPYTLHVSIKRVRYKVIFNPSTMAVNSWLICETGRYARVKERRQLRYLLIAGWIDLARFYGISAIVGYLIPNHFSTYILNI